ncbi:MAG: diacylglycerol kinase family lipid kinase [Rhodospirillales bacterium]|nr:diacylglycerol kinase family lipid kinase [Rhodospirillales bacterium]MDE2198214.1 diacylglycerol kinase family lipid kinase [Rhodospirillales bacterium]MDE2574976.1 diacylglycerol kinase family lipid kinase [Rhodospirillales bacterium]
MVIIFNPVAGRRRAALLWRVLDVMSQSGVRLDIVETQRAGHGGEMAREAARAGVNLVVAAGGDGTIAEVAAGLAGSPCRLGIIPLGTANVLAHELALPFAPREVAAALAFGRTRTVWPGIAESALGPRLFVQMLGAGFDAQVVHHLPPGLKRALGRGAYVAQSMREAGRYGFPPIRLRLDGVACEAGSVIVTKGHFYAGRYVLAPGADPGERGFTVALFGRTGPLAALAYGAALPLNRLAIMPGVRLVRAAVVEILSADIPAQADGDPAGVGPIAIHDATQPLSIVVGSLVAGTSAAPARRWPVAGGL